MDEKDQIPCLWPGSQALSHRRKLTQEELAEKVGVVTSYISMMESGQEISESGDAVCAGRGFGAYRFRACGGYGTPPLRQCQQLILAVRGAPQR